MPAATRNDAPPVLGVLAKGVFLKGVDFVAEQAGEGHAAAARRRVKESRCLRAFAQAVVAQDLGHAQALVGKDTGAALGLRGAVRRPVAPRGHGGLVAPER